MAGEGEVTANNDANPDKSQLIEGDLKQELAQHLSAEITAQSTFLTAFRTRIAFIVLIGPFVILGSFLIAIKENIGVIKLPPEPIWPAFVAGGAYFFLGLYGAYLDGQIMTKSNDWRDLMVKLCSNSSVTTKDASLTFKHKLKVPWGLAAAYSVGIILVLGAFLAVVLLLQAVQP